MKRDKLVETISQAKDQYVNGAIERARAEAEHNFSLWELLDYVEDNPEVLEKVTKAGREAGYSVMGYLKFKIAEYGLAAD
jgi:hypothetical protein